MLFLNKKHKKENIFINDLFKFDFKKVNKTTFKNQKMLMNIKNENIEEIFVHVISSENINIVGLDIYNIKEGKIHSIHHTTSPSLMSDIFNYSEQIEKIKNIKKEDVNYQNINLKNNKKLIMSYNMKELDIGFKTKDRISLKYNDIIKIDLNTLKIKNILSDKFKETLEERNIKNMYIHIYDAGNENNEYFTTPLFDIYLTSDEGFENKLTKVQQENRNEALLRIPGYLPYNNNAFHCEYNDISFLFLLNKNDLFLDIIGNKNNRNLKLLDLNEKLIKSLKFKNK